VTRVWRLRPWPGLGARGCCRSVLGSLRRVRGLALLPWWFASPERLSGWACTRTNWEAGRRIARGCLRLGLT